MVAVTQWLTVIALAATPALVLGQSAAAAAGIGFGLDPWIMVPVIALRWLGIETRKMWLPTFASNVVFAVLYYWIVRLGWSWI